MSLIQVPLDRLLPHPGNSNRMPPDRFAKLLSHLRRSGRYPPVIVRPAPQAGGLSPGFPAPDAATDNATHHDRAIPPGRESDDSLTRYQILDGHHRVEALRQLGHASAWCLVWQADEREALILLTTLNRLQGEDDPRKRAALVAELRDVSGAAGELEQLADLLPETAQELDKLLRLHQPPPRPIAPPDPAALPVAVHFFLLPAERTELESRLRSLHPRRESALMSLVRGNLDTPSHPTDR